MLELKLIRIDKRSPCVFPNQSPVVYGALAPITSTTKLWPDDLIGRNLP